MKSFQTLAAVGCLMLLGSNLSAQSPDDKVAEKVQEFFQQLDKLSDEQLQEKAEATCERVIRQLTFGPEVEIYRTRRATWEKHLVAIDRRIGREQQELNSDRDALRQKVESIREQESGSQLASYRVQTAIEAYQAPIERRLLNLQTLLDQRKQIETQVDRYRKLEKQAEDRLEYAPLTPALDSELPILPPVPSDVADPWGDLPFARDRAVEKPTTSGKSSSVRSNDEMLARLGVTIDKKEK